MKKCILALLALLVVFNSFSQVILTYKNNSPLPNDTIRTSEIDLVTPGDAGPNQVWDFSKIRLTGEQKESIMINKIAQPMPGLSDFDATFSDRGYEYFYKTDETASEVVGLRTKDISVSFSDPIIKMKYPLFYGNMYTDQLSGKATDKYKSDIGISGDYSLEADAFGTIILHDRIIKNVLRLKIVENKIQINPCNIAESTITTYLWYAPASRYPVVGMSAREVKSNGKNPVTTAYAYINQKMANSGLLISGTDPENVNLAEVTLTVYPNPFIETLNYTYFLRKPMPVTIEMVDITGKTIIILADEQLHSEGFHTGELDAVKCGLKMGVYYFRFKFDGKELVRKVVKM